MSQRLVCLEFVAMDEVVARRRRMEVGVVGEALKQIDGVKLPIFLDEIRDATEKDPSLIQMEVMKRFSIQNLEVMFLALEEEQIEAENEKLQNHMESIEIEMAKVNTRSKFSALVEDEQEYNPDSNEGIKAMESEQAPGELEGQDPPEGPTRNSLERHDRESAARRNQQRWYEVPDGELNV
ncbi:hypothetical protein Cgig2_026761 [Carnegiea gigantea]|uniref:Uncharacterized protein n=1 Tax=Carnegiea gigantea TaxID=171969 RepID=A0A9Q1JSG3_9CARY|nr:hypothetical protein Cgig2_026761 [Carnegiea gigantea]